MAESPTVQGFFVQVLMIRHGKLYLIKLTLSLVFKKRYMVGDFIYVRNEASLRQAKKKAASKPRKHDRWIARISEIRGINTTEVYVIVSWMYRPDDLPSNIRTNCIFSNDELVASNHRKCERLFRC